MHGHYGGVWVNKDIKNGAQAYADIQNGACVYIVIEG